MDTEVLQMFYISKIRLKNIKCFPGEVAIDLSQPSTGNPSWTLLLGDNGTGKTSFLRCIAMCLCDETSASGLLTELSGNIIRDGCKDAAIELHLASANQPKSPYKITTKFHKTDSNTEGLKQTTEPEKGFPRAELLACGYGAAFGTIGSEVYERYRPIDAVYSLFNYTARLQNPENALFRISQEDVELEQLLARIDRILMLPPGSTALDSSGLRVRGPWGNYVPAGALGDGYAATLAWICDLLGWSLLATRGEFDVRVQAIVLLDEIEKHLHPSWQRQIVGLLAKEFPAVQFIASTHAPLTAIGSTSLQDECCQLILMQHESEGVEIRSGLKPPRDRRADQVLTSFLFGLLSTTSDELIEKVERYANLKQKNSLDDRQEIETLRMYLTETLGTPETELQRTVEKAVHDTLSSMVKQQPIDNEALALETRRQLRRLFESQG